MGVIDIRLASERLQGLRVPTANPLGGTLTSGTDGLASLGRGAGGALNKGIALFAQLQERDDRKKMDEFYNRYCSAMDRYNVSFADDGTPQGAMQKTFSDGTKWLKDNDDYRKMIFEHIAGDDPNGMKLSERQKKLAERRVAEFDRHLDRMWNDRANSFYVAQETAGSNEAFKRTSELVATDPTPGNLKAWREAGERVMAIKGVATPENKEAFWRNASLKALQDGEGLEFSKTAAAADAAGVNGEKVWDDLIAKTDHRARAVREEKDGKVVYRSPAANLSDGELSRYHEEWTKRAKAAKAEWLKEMKTSTDRSYESARTDITAIPTPNPSDAAAVRDYEKDVGLMYWRMLYRLDAKGNKELTDFGARLKAYAPLKFASANACIAQHEKKYDKARVDTNGAMLLDMLDAGVEDEWYAGGRRMLTSAEKSHLAEFLMAHNEINKADYHAALKRINEQDEPLALEFWNTVLKGTKGDFPKVAAWKADMLAYAFKDTEAARKFSAGNSDFEHYYTNDTGDEQKERMLNTQVMEAARIACQRMFDGRKRGETDDQALKRAVEDFNRMTSDAQDGIMKLSYKRRFDAENARLDNLKSQRRQFFGGAFPAQFDVRPATRLNISKQEEN